jgi:hypothetical protein
MVAVPLGRAMMCAGGACRVPPPVPSVCPPGVVGTRDHPVQPPVRVAVLGPGVMTPGGADAHPEPVRPDCVAPSVGAAVEDVGAGVEDVGAAVEDVGGPSWATPVRVRKGSAHTEDDAAQRHQAGDRAEAPAADREVPAAAARPRASRGGDVDFLLVGTWRHDLTRTP